MAFPKMSYDKIVFNKRENRIYLHGIALGIEISAVCVLLTLVF